MNDDDFELSIPEHLRKLINPKVLAQVTERIRQREEAESASPYHYRRYLETHANHIIAEAIRLSKLTGESNDD